MWTRIVYRLARKQIWALETEIIIVKKLITALRTDVTRVNERAAAAERELAASKQWTELSAMIKYNIMDTTGKLFSSTELAPEPGFGYGSRYPHLLDPHEIERMEMEAKARLIEHVVSELLKGSKIGISKQYQALSNQTFMVYMLRTEPAQFHIAFAVDE